MKTEILKVIIGSQAHGLATPESDTDYRSVFITPTENFFTLGVKKEELELGIVSEIKDSFDDTTYELGRFIDLACKSNPSILEVFKSPVVSSNQNGKELVNLFDSVWSGVGVYNAFRGYGHNQRNRMIENKDGKMHKFATAWLRTIFNAICLFDHGDFQMNILGSPIEPVLKRWKVNLTANTQKLFEPLTAGEVIDTVNFWEKALTEVYESSIFKDKQTDYKAVNDFVFRMRKEWFNVDYIPRHE